uniref:LAM_G_DOMAIN domain-containing protein n=1 Tax=Macrostomum lignano TaxID=282301 RepID=A0A1I8FMR1_9PLAT
MQNFAAVPNSAYGASRAYGGGAAAKNDFDRLNGGTATYWTQCEPACGAAAAAQPLPPDVPCVNANLTQANFTGLVNPRPNGELRVLLKLPFDRGFLLVNRLQNKSQFLYSMTRFLILGVWAERHHLELNQPQPFNGSAHPDAASRPSWRVVDVTEVSRIAEFDFLMDESHGLTKDTEYFVALSGCSSTQCRTAGFAKFTAWQQGGGPQNLAAIIAGSCAAVVAACVIAVGVTLGVRLRVCDRHTAQLGTVSSASAAAAIPSTE